jgi:ubiquinone/menaquinone biosynthesis C-methylase UbiE
LSIGELVTLKYKQVLLYLTESKVVPTDFRKSFDWSASFYDKEWAPYITGVSDEVISKLPAFSPKYILDAGCGTGLSTMKLRKLFPDAHITAMDFSRQMLKSARKHLGTDNVLLFREMIEKGVSKFKDSQFNLVSLMWSLEYTQDKKVYKDLHRILSPGGYLLVITRKQDALPGINNAFQQTLSKNSTKVRKNLSHKFPLDKAELLSNFDKMFEEVASGEGNFLIDLKSKSFILDWVLNTGVLAGFEFAIDLRNSETCRSSFENYVKNNLFEDNFTYMWLILKKV